MILFQILIPFNTPSSLLIPLRILLVHLRRQQMKDTTFIIPYKAIWDLYFYKQNTEFKNIYYFGNI